MRIVDVIEQRSEIETKRIPMGLLMRLLMRSMMSLMVGLVVSLMMSLMELR